MSKPIEALAQDASAIYEEEICKSDRPLDSKVYVYRDYKAGFEAGAKAASGRVAELEAALDKLIGAVKCYNSHKPGYCVVCDVVETRKALSGAGKGEG